MIDRSILKNKAYLLEKLVEEAAEVIQAVQKVKLFSAQHKYDDKSNIEHLSNEIKDFLVVLELYSKQEPEVPVVVDKEYRKYKEDRLVYYGQFSNVR